MVIEIPGKPVGKKYEVSRGKLRRSDKTIAFESFVGTLAKLKSPPEPWTGAVAVQIIFHLVPIPSWPMWRRRAALEGRLWCKAVPDGDNVCKSICDAMTGIVYVDDRQNTDYLIRKRWGPEEKTVVTVTLLEYSPTQTRFL